MFIDAIADPAEICVPVIVTTCGAAWFAATTPATSAGGVAVGAVLLLPHAVSVMVITQPARMAVIASSVNSRRLTAEAAGIERAAVDMRTPLRFFDERAFALSQELRRLEKRRCSRSSELLSYRH